MSHSKPSLSVIAEVSNESFGHLRAALIPNGWTIRKVMGGGGRLGKCLESKEKRKENNSAKKKEERCCQKESCVSKWDKKYRASKKNNPTLTPPTPSSSPITFLLVHTQKS